MAPAPLLRPLLLSCLLVGTAFATSETELTATSHNEPTSMRETDDTTVAPDSRFLDRLGEDQLMATGVHELTPLQRANLENLIAYEVHSAQAGGVNGFARTFSERRTSAEIEATGIDHLSEDQREALDQHVAGFIADQAQAFVYMPSSERARRLAETHADEDFTGQGPRLLVRNAITVEAGTSDLGTYYGGSATTVISDPKGRFQAVISYGQWKSDYEYPRSRTSQRPR